MRKLRWHIALLVGGSVLLMLLIFMGAFNLMMHYRIETNADESIRNMILPDTVTGSEPFLYSPEMIMVMQQDDDGSMPVQFYTPKERNIINWCESKAPGVLQKTEIGGNSYYLMIADDEMIQRMTESNETGDENFMISSVIVVSDADDDDRDSYSVSAYTNDISRIINYVDITGELEVIRKINIVFLIAALVIGALGSTMGYFIGRKLVQNQFAQKQFFENTSHELKTPLTSIHGYAEGIEKGVITDYPRTGRIIAAQTEKMSRLVEEILCMAKLESGSVKLERETVSMPDFLQDCLMPFEGTVLSRGLEVMLDLQQMTVSADSDKLEHAVSNLLTNAVKYAQTHIQISCGKGMNMYTEAPWLYRRQNADGTYYGDYYLIYAYRWREQTAYSTCTDLLKGDWKFGSVIFECNATSNTNHSGIFDFKGKTYMIYHNGALPEGNGYRRCPNICEVHFDSSGRIMKMEETKAGIGGVVSTISDQKGALLGHAAFTNSINDNAYPYVNVALGFGMQNLTAHDTEWVIVPGLCDVENQTYVSIESENKTGLYVTVNANGSGAVPAQQTSIQQNDLKRATFRTITGLSDRRQVSFESVSNPGRYLTAAANGTLTLTDGSDAAACTFRISENG